MQTKTKLLIILLLAPALIFYACKKYQDPPDATFPSELTDHYCNDPRAVNYNWNFPGIEDSLVCVFPVDSFQGSWTYYDTTYLPSGDTAGTAIRNLVFTSTEDSVKMHMTVAGWCSANATFNVTANKYNRSELDSLPGSYSGQFFCSQADTAVGAFYKDVSDTTSFNKMVVDITVTSGETIQYHKGVAIRQ